MQVEQRQAIEQQIMRSAITELIAAGFVLSVFDGEDVTVGKSTDVEALFQALRTTDEDYLFAYMEGDGRKEVRRFVQFVYGNDGWDVIADYSPALDDYLTETNMLADRLASEIEAAR